MQNRGQERIEEHHLTQWLCAWRAYAKSYGVLGGSKSSMM